MECPENSNFTRLLILLLLANQESCFIRSSLHFSANVVTIDICKPDAAHFSIIIPLFFTTLPCTSNNIKIVSFLDFDIFRFVVFSKLTFLHSLTLYHSVRVIIIV